APLRSLEQIANHVGRLQVLLEWFYTLVDEQDHLELAVDRVTHEIQTRLQALISKAELLVDKIGRVTTQEASESAFGVLCAVEALTTVIQTLGDALGEYRFLPTGIFPLLSKARDIYASEAAARGIEIVVECPLSLEAEISEPHFQHALNNL